MSWQRPDGAEMMSPRKDTTTASEDRRITGVLMAALKSQGWSNCKIARRFGTNDKQVKRILDRLPAETRSLCG